ncbi:hypothetical protein HMPREF9018_0503 [Prevotella amnii CRIS 21A-A]|uniref:Uncharacterized protein n=1 Tax=Prevotella amnii CRIS 21A-A TaxID=679191 RepID=E1GWL2_9BACT|nr:hypothetical protein HMPREF9018_0503 [Prevotella amnii CRIS 21A-A]
MLFLVLFWQSCFSKTMRAAFLSYFILFIIAKERGIKAK